METAKLFMTGRSQAVRLPKAFRFADGEVFIKRIGKAVVLIPQEHPWDTLFESLEQFEPGFKLERDQPVKAQKRATLLK